MITLVTSDLKKIYEKPGGPLPCDQSIPQWTTGMCFTDHGLRTSALETLGHLTSDNKNQRHTFSHTSGVRIFQMQLNNEKCFCNKYRMWKIQTYQQGGISLTSYLKAEIQVG